MKVIWSISTVSLALLSLAVFCAARQYDIVKGFRSKFSELRCHTCDQETCKVFDKSSEPKNCTIDDLMEDNLGPTLLRNLTHIPFHPDGAQVPEFICQKIEAYSIREGKLELRRCALRYPVNQTCDFFYEKLEKVERGYFINATCALCGHDGCNSSGLPFMWIPLLFISIVVCVIINWFQ